MYKVIKNFVDLQDNGHRYNAGDEFPRKGLKVSDSRINSLLGYGNRQRTPLIAEVSEDKPTDETPEETADEKAVDEVAETTDENVETTEDKPEEKATDEPVTKSKSNTKK